MVFLMKARCAQTGVVGTGGKNNWSWIVEADCIEKEAPEQRQDCSKKISSVVAS